tara:strand:+ start:742 stop:2184 length:1443 start_codon:yes stop_codon:yes gene_type:complete
MGYTIEQKPNQLAATNSPMVFVLKESDSAIYNATKFRYIAQVYISTTDESTWVEKAKLKIHKNASNVGIVDVHKIVRSYLETQTKVSIENPGGTFTEQTGITGNIHCVGIGSTARPFSSNTSQLIGVKLVGGYEKSTSATTAPSESLTLANTIIYATNSSTPFTQLDSNVGGLDKDGTNNPMQQYIPYSSTRSFLTNAPTAQFVRGGDAPADNVDRGTVAFIQDGNTVLITDGDPVVRIYIQYHQADGTSIGTHWFVNELANGGIATADDVRNSLLYFGCGTANLEAQTDNTGARPSENDGWAYYRIWGANGSGTPETQHYYFYKYGSGASGIDDRHQSCTRFDNIRLAWVNRLGAWDYMNFRGKSKESVDITRTDIAKVSGTWDSATFSYENQDRGKQTLYTEAKRKLTINSDWLNEDEGAWLEELFTSTNVQILGDSNIVYPVIVTDKAYTKKTSVNNKIKIQYTVNLEYANKVRTNS